MPNKSFRYLLQAHAPNPQAPNEAFTYDGYVRHDKRIGTSDDFAAVLNDLAAHIEKTQSIAVDPSTIVLQRLEFVCESTVEEDSKWFSEASPAEVNPIARSEVPSIRWLINVRFGLVLTLTTTGLAAMFSAIQGWSLKDSWLLALVAVVGCGVQAGAALYGWMRQRPLSEWSTGEIDELVKWLPDEEKVLRRRCSLSRFGEMSLHHLQMHLLSQELIRRGGNENAPSDTSVSWFDPAVPLIVDALAILIASGMVSLMVLART